MALEISLFGSKHKKLLSTPIEYGANHVDSFMVLSCKRACVFYVSGTTRFLDHGLEKMEERKGE